MRLSEKLIHLCEAKRLSDRELSRLVGGVSATTVGRWKTEEGEPRLSEAIKLARVLEVSLDYLADEGDEDMPAVADKEAISRFAQKAGVKLVRIGGVVIDLEKVVEIKMSGSQAEVVFGPGFNDIFDDEDAAAFHRFIQALPDGIALATSGRALVQRDIESAVQRQQGR